MNCEVAREALSARLDGEREPVPSTRVDEHLDECGGCRAWFEQVRSQSRNLRGLIDSRPVMVAVDATAPGTVPPRGRRWLGWLGWRRWALLGVGVTQLALAVAQGLGVNVGLTRSHAMGSDQHLGHNPGHHLLNESTAWSLALGVIMIGAALWPGAAAGLAGVLGVFVAVLSVYVVVDALSGDVTAARMLTHLPVVIGAVLATLVWRSASPPSRTPDSAAIEPDIVLPENASRGRRRGHLWPTDDSAA